MVESPNVILIVIDTLRYDYAHKMESWRELAALGVEFERMYAASTFTYSNLATIKTGLYPPAHNWRTWPTGGPLADVLTLEDYLQLEGYTIINRIEIPYKPHDTIAAFGRLGDYTDSQPFFLYIHQNSLHDRSFKRQYLQDGIPPEYYEGLLPVIDKWLSSTMDKFRELDLFDNTIFVIVSDHGVGLAPDKLVGEGLDVGAGQVFDFRVRVPCLMIGTNREDVKWSIAQPRSHADILPILLEMLMIDYRQIDGFGIYQPLDRLAYLEAQSPNSIWPSDEPNVFGATDGIVKLTITPEGIRVYDLIGDPGETEHRQDLFDCRFVDFIEEVWRGRD